MFTTLIPAYGRTYKNQKQVRDDWDAGKDFVISNLFHPDDGRYINKDQAKVGERFNVRYGKNGTKAMVVSA